MLLESLQARGLTDYFEKEAKAIKVKADKSEPFYYYSLFAWELLTYNFDSFQTPKIFNSSPEKMLEYINIHSDLERLQCWLSLLNHINLSLFAPKDISTLSEEELLKKKKNKQLVRRLKKYLRNLKKKATFQEPIIKVYHIALKFLLSLRMAKTEKA